MFEELLSKRGLSFDRLAALVNLAKAGTLAEAALQDPVRQSLLSRQIKELEEFFDVSAYKFKPFLEHERMNYINEILIKNDVSDDQEEIYKERMLSIMQIVFLVEELEGRYVRPFLEAEELGFREYMNEAYLDYNQIVVNRKRE